ncbi:MAG: HPr family phosphocarrier protein [Spirochaetaceae bacterium]|nr:MAG: HPr family phosphocarrier protein [Spirochaetaceae bacterium]
MKETTLTVKHKVGLHARPAAKFVKAAKQFDSKIQISNITRGGDRVSAKSLVSLVKIAVACGHQVHITADGSDEDQAIEALTEFIVNTMEEQP